MDGLTDAGPKFYVLLSLVGGGGSSGHYGGVGAIAPVADIMGCGLAIAPTHGVVGMYTQLLEKFTPYITGFFSHLTKPLMLII